MNNTLRSVARLFLLMKRIGYIPRNSSKCISRSNDDKYIPYTPNRLPDSYIIDFNDTGVCYKLSKKQQAGLVNMLRDF